jgi:putative DNA primase/helicase
MNEHYQNSESPEVPAEVPASPAPRLRPTEPRFRLTDVGNADRLVAGYGSVLLYCNQWRNWLIWDNRRWKPDDTKKIMQFAKATVRSMYTDASRASDTALMNHARYSESCHQLDSMVKVAQDELAVIPSELDSDPHLFNCQNGVIDLKTGKLERHRRDWKLSKMSPVAFDPNVRCKTWLAFLERIFAGDRETISFVRRVIGYSLTGDVNEKAMFVFWGDGNNGKTTLLEAVRYIMGDYAAVVETDSLMNNASTNEQQRMTADLLGKRFATASEAEEGQRLKEARIKQLTGMGKQIGRRLYGQQFEFYPQYKLFIDANHKPVIRGNDPAIWDRVKLIPFNVSIPKSEQDKDLLKKLKEEAPGILAWAVEGCLEWQRKGLGNPSVVSRAVEDYRQEMDLVRMFIDDCCATDNPAATAPVSALYGRFKQWCGQLGEAPVSPTAFGTWLTKNGFTEKRTASTRMRAGLALKAETGTLQSLPLAA